MANSNMHNTKAQFIVKRLLVLYFFLEGTCEYFELNDEIELKKNYLLTILQTLPKEYEISFEVKPTAFLQQWGNVVHLTLSSNNESYGDRIYAVWLTGDGDISFRVSINGSQINKLFALSSPLMKWTEVKGIQRFINGIYVFTIYIAEVNVYTVENNNPTDFRFVKVYTSDPWYDAQPGFLRNIYIDAFLDSFTMREDTVLTRNQLISILTKLHEEYQLSFEYKPTQYTGVWSCVIHLSISGNLAVYGDRTPAVLVAPDANLEIGSAINGAINKNYFYGKLPTGVWTKITVTQIVFEKKYVYTVKINETVIHTEENIKTQEFENVKVYIGTPWDFVQPGFIRNLAITNALADSFALTEDTPLIRNRLVAVLYKLPKEYQLSFELKLTQYGPNELNSILLLTIGGNGTVYGDRTPAVFISSEGYLQFYFVINGNDAQQINHTTKLLLDDWTNILVKQIVLESKLKFIIEVAKTVIYSVENLDPRVFYDVDVYLGNPWVTIQPGYVRNLIITNAASKNNCSFMPHLSSEIKNDEVQIYVSIEGNPLCFIDLENITVYLHHEIKLFYKGFVRNDLSLSLVSFHEANEFTITFVRKMLQGSYVAFSNMYHVDQSQIPLGKTNVSIIAVFFWPEYIRNKLNYKDMKYIIFIPAKSSVQPVNKIFLKWSYNHQNGTYFRTGTHQYVCTAIQKRQQSSCYQLEITTGRVRFLPVQLLDMIGYDPSNNFIYGYTFRNNIVEVILNDELTINIISNKRWLKVKGSNNFKWT